MVVTVEVLVYVEGIVVAWDPGFTYVVVAGSWYY
jgi:hypothetical protein